MIGVYLVFVYVVSFKEYREVIRERFGPPGTPTDTETEGGYRMIVHILESPHGSSAPASAAGCFTTRRRVA